MNRPIAFYGFVLAMLGLLSFAKPQSSSIKGKVTPAQYAEYAWAISDTDTLYTTVNNGIFDFTNAQPGVYRIIIGASSPYRHTVKDSVIVKKGQAKDIGEVPLEKYVAVLK